VAQLLTAAENDILAASAQALFDALRCPRTLLQFKTAEGAGDHCEMFNRSLLNRRALDSTSNSHGEQSLPRIASRGAAAHDRRDHARMR
jgi:hypothetical protein